MGFSPATKEQSKARVLLHGPSGSGKTFTALSIARGFGARIAVLDTENGSAAKYAGLPHEGGGKISFDVDSIGPPYEGKRIISALKSAIDGGYDVLVIDSLTHFWKGTGGVMDYVDLVASRSSKGDKFGAWKEGDKVYREYTDAILHAPIHVIATLRAKQTHEKNEATRKIEKLGMQPEYREGGEYEFDLEGALDMSHTLHVGKSRVHRVDGSTLDGKSISRPGPKLGQEILAWCTDGAPALVLPAGPPPTPPADHPIPPPRPATMSPADLHAQAIADIRAQLETAPDLEATQALAKQVKGLDLTPEEKADLEKAYLARRAELKAKAA